MADANPASTHEAVRQFSFKAETKQLLNILIHSLYKDHEVFLPRTTLQCFRCAEPYEL